MKTATVTEFRKKMKGHLHQLEMDQDILMVLTLEQFNAMEETAHLLSTPANANHLLESIKQDRAGKAVRRTLKLMTSKPSATKKQKTKVKE
jgi:antitoxin YefM